MLYYVENQRFFWRFSPLVRSTSLWLSLVVKKGGYTESTFRDAPPGSILGRLFAREAERNGGDHERAVLPLREALDAVVTVPNTALYYQVRRKKDGARQCCQFGRLSV